MEKKHQGKIRGKGKGQKEMPDAPQILCGISREKTGLGGKWFV